MQGKTAGQRCQILGGTNIRRSDDKSATFSPKCDQSEVRDNQELVADAAEEAFDFSLGGGVADGGVAQEAANAGADKGDLLAAVDRAVIDQELLGDAAFVEGGAEGLHEGIDVFVDEEFAVAEDAAGVVDEGDQPGLLAAR